VSDKTVAAVRLPGTQTEGSVPFLSVVMPVRNEESHIAAVLAQLEMQSYPQDRLEVLVVDGNSTDGTVRVVDKFAHQTSLGIRLLRNPAQRSSAGRNVGARNARGEYVIFIDGHCHIPSKTLLVDVVELFDKTGVDCLCRPQPLTMPGETLFQEVVGHARATVLGHGRDSTIYATELEGSVNPCSSGAMYRRNVFERVGYYDETFDACEDVEFNYRVFNAGLTSYLSSRLAVFYQPRTSLSSLWQQMIRYGRGRFRLIRKHRGAFSLSQVLPAAVLLWFVIGGIASLFSRLFAACFLVTLAIYLLIVLGFSIALGLRYGWRHLLQSPAVYFVIHFGLGAGFLAEFLAAVRGRSHRSAVSANSATLVPDSTATAGIPIRKSTPRAEGS
jgi:glycosyltransferase involved in cell wall biosynthesis